MRRPLAALVVAAVYAGGCTSAEYDVVVRFVAPPSPGEIARVEVFVVDSCGTYGDTGVDPVAPTTAIELERGGQSASLGEVAPGSYGIYARGRSDACTVGPMPRAPRPDRAQPYTPTRRGA